MNKTISFYLPEKVLDNDELVELYSGWTTEKIFNKTGIKRRHISGKDEYTSDMAIKAANKLFGEYKIEIKEIEFLIVITQGPDYLIPTTACIIQDKLGLSTSCGAFDINLGCSGYIYGLSVAKSLIISKTADVVLLITADVYTKFIHDMDRSTRTIFGDGATATLINKNNVNDIGSFVFGTNGAGSDKLIIPNSGARSMSTKNKSIINSENCENSRTDRNIYMDGTEIFKFTIETVPNAIYDVLKKNSLKISDIDLFVFHQANKFMLDYLRKTIGIPEDKFYINIADIGNTVSSTIPIALKMAYSEGILREGHLVMLVGFGVGLSWGATIMKW